ncbi:LysR family transcriptional regulator [Sphingomonas sp. XXL09]|uniref:LysR family transcriptional regulator n=1 Tax=Sphingomonas sp. XXL09 TaxID=3457787 RepID=UPI00406BCEB0
MPLDPDYDLFALVAEAGSLSAAARAIGISPAMASKRLARLEQRLGVRLVHRTTRRLVLTPAGAQFRDDLNPVRAAVREAEARIAGETAAPAGRLTVSAPTSFGRLHLAPHLGSFLRAYPAVALRIDLDDGFVDLASAGVDVAIRIAPSVRPPLVGHRLATSRRVLCAGPRYLAERGVPTSIDALAAHRLLAADGQMPWRLVAPGTAATIDRPSAVATNSSEMVRELALDGAGIALRSIWDVGDLLAEGRLVRVLAPWEGTTDSAVHAVHLPAPRVRPAVAAFVDFMQSRIDPDGWTLPPAAVPDRSAPPPHPA